MTKRYTVVDFVNARFAEHPDGGIAYRVGEYTDTPWESALDFHYDEDMARGGWVPVPTKPTLSDSEVGDIAKAQSDDWLLGFITGYEKAGGTILDETTRERVARLVNEAVDGRGIVSVGEKVADRLIDLGLVKGN